MPLACTETQSMPGPFFSSLPPRGSTDWGVRQFLRMLDEEERIAAERDRLSTAGWQTSLSVAPIQALAGGSAFAGNDSGYVDTHRQKANESALDDGLSHLGRGGDGRHDWVAGGRFSTPLPQQGNVFPVYARPKLNEYGRPIAIAPGIFSKLPERTHPNSEPAAGLAPAPSSPHNAVSGSVTSGSSRLSQEIPRPRFMIAPTIADGGEDEFAPVPGLGEIRAAQQYHRAVAREMRLDEQARRRELAIELLEDGATSDSILTDAWASIASLFEDGIPTDQPPAPAARIADERILVQEIVEAFSDAGIFLWESPETRQDNLDIIAMVEKAVRECGAIPEHKSGAGKPEQIYRKFPQTLKFSRRPDGSILIHYPDGRTELYEFNTADTYADGSFTNRERLAAVDIAALQKEIDAKVRKRFDVYGKSRMTKGGREEWRRRIRPLVEKAVRSFMNCKR